MTAAIAETAPTTIPAMPPPLSPPPPPEDESSDCDSSGDDVGSFAAFVPDEVEVGESSRYCIRVSR